MDRADQIGVFLEAAFDADQLVLRLPILRQNMTAKRTSPARVLRRRGDGPAPSQALRSVR